MGGDSIRACFLLECTSIYETVLSFPKTMDFVCDVSDDYVWVFDS